MRSREEQFDVTGFDVQKGRSMMTRKSQYLLGLVFFALFGSSLAGVAAPDEYRLHSGDTIEFSATGLPELKQPATISMAGEVVFPLVGRLSVAGLAVSEVSDKVRQLLPSKLFRRRTDDGREYPVAVSPDEVTIRVVEYRPVYLNGDVAKPGEQTFRPGMTVRQAVALAGGYDLARFRMNNPFLELSDLRSDYDRLWGDFARSQVRVARLKAELNGRTEIDRTQLLPTPLTTSVVGQIEQLETDQFASRKIDLVKERAYLEASIKREQGRVGVLTEQQKRETQGTEFDAEDLDRVTELYKKGTIPITRLVEARRSILLSSTRVLQTRAGLASVERELEEFRRKLQKLDDHRRLELTGGLQEEEARLDSTRTRLQAVSEKLVYTGLVRSQLVRGKGSKPDISIVRTGLGAGQIAADGEMELRPGDVIEISLQADMTSVQSQ